MQGAWETMQNFKPGTVRRLIWKVHEQYLQKCDLQFSHMFTHTQCPAQLAYRAMKQTLTLVGCKWGGSAPCQAPSYWNLVGDRKFEAYSLLGRLFNKKEKNCLKKSLKFNGQDFVLSEVELGPYLSFPWCIGGELGASWGSPWSSDSMVCRLLSGVIRGPLPAAGLLSTRRAEITQVDWSKVWNLKQIGNNKYYCKDLNHCS